MQLAVLFDLKRYDSKLFVGFTEDRLERGLARINLAAGSVDFARSEAALLSDKENFFVAQDEAEVGTLARLPVSPVGHIARFPISFPWQWTQP
jgi:hypothetical protein